ncbi:MAG: DegT/DnrJ/EryC1/StrS family aminotransferase, partial [Chitinophagaceae bacterium]
FNYRMTDYQAALAWSQFQRLDNILEYKQELSKLYFSSLQNAQLILPFIPENRNHTWQTFHVMISDEWDQKEIIDKLKQHHIGSNYGAQCIPAQTYYKKKYQLNTSKEFPNAFKAYTKGVAIPIYEKLSREDIFYIAQIINQL